MGTRRFNISAKEEIHDGIRAHTEAAGVDTSTYMIAAAIQQMIRDGRSASSTRFIRLICHSRNSAEDFTAMYGSRTSVSDLR